MKNKKRKGEGGILRKGNTHLRKLTFDIKHSGGGASHGHQYTESLTQNISEGQCLFKLQIKMKQEYMLRRSNIGPEILQKP